MTAVWLFFPAQGMVYRNGAVYFEVSAFMLAVTATVAYLLIKLVCRILSRRAGKEELRTVTVAMREKTVTLQALVDTGNRLCDLFTGLPVVVSSFDAVKPLIPPSLHAYFSTGIPPDLSILKAEEIRMIRMIPVRTVTGEQLLPCFRPDGMTVNGEARRAVIAVCPNALSDGVYHAVLSSALT